MGLSVFVKDKKKAGTPFGEVPALFLV